MHRSRREAEFDYVVVGAGSAGCVLAHRLSERPSVRVLLLEAGGRDWSPYLRVPAGRVRMSDKYDWRYPAEPDPSRANRAEAWESGKVLGGSSSINGMFWVRGAPEDYDEWAALGCTGWDFGSVLPCFRRAETFEGGADEYRGGNGPQHVSRLRLRHPLTDDFVASAVNAGFGFNPDYNGAHPDGVGYGQVTQKRGLRHSTAQAYLAPARRRRNLRILTRAHVRRVVLDGERAYGVEFEHGGRLATATCTREVVLSAGAIGSPKLLLLSGLGPREELAAVGVEPRVDLPGVGRNLQNHLYLSIIHEVAVPTLNRELTVWNVAKHGLDLLVRGRGPATSAFGHAVVFGSTDGTRTDFELIFAPYGLFASENGRSKRRESGTVRLMTVNAVTTRVGLMRPRTRGSVALRSHDPADSPVIRYESAGRPEDVADMTAACRTAREVIATAPLGTHVVRELKPGANVENDVQWEEAIRGTAGIGKHAAGSCRMGADDHAVVDPALRVRGVDGLRVIDLSVAPVITSGNTNAAAIMIGERGADLVTAEL